MSTVEGVEADVVEFVDEVADSHDIDLKKTFTCMKRVDNCSKRMEMDLW